jgi:hypothetical protein
MAELTDTLMHLNGLLLQRVPGLAPYSSVGGVGPLGRAGGFGLGFLCVCHGPSAESVRAQRAGPQEGLAGVLGK